MALIGFDKCHYAICTVGTDGTETYSTPKAILGAMSCNITPNINSAVLYADDGAYAEASALGAIEMELEVADINLETQAELLGHTYASGKLTRKSSDIAPYIAIGGRTLLDDGTYRYFWLLKGKFQIPEQSKQTKGENVEFNTPTISGNFLKRNKDSAWIMEADETATDIATWFTAVK